MKDFFSIFGISKSFKLDQAKLEDQFFDLSKRLHPDRFVNELPAMKAKSHALSAELNDAYQTLKSPEQRLEYLLKSEGFTNPTEKKIPLDLAEEFFEVQENLNLASSFKEKLLDLIESYEKEMYMAAERVDWSRTKSQLLEIEQILQKKEALTYVRSILQNLERLL